MKTPFVLILSVGLIASSCIRNNEQSEPVYPIPPFTVTFRLVDSAGNNILPYNLPADPVFDPADFSAHSKWSGNIGDVRRSPHSGHTFQMREKLSNITHDPNFQRDSSFRFYPCFKLDCDTVIIHKPKLVNGWNDSIFWGTAQKLIWNRDTFKNYHHTSPLLIHKF
jgi:hypothetical protein